MSKTSVITLNRRAERAVKREGLECPRNADERRMRDWFRHGFKQGVRAEQRRAKR
jgi:hypothetical protein